MHSFGLWTRHPGPELHHASAMHHGWIEHQVIPPGEAVPEADAASEHQRKKREADLVNERGVEALAHEVAPIEIDVPTTGQSLGLGHEFVDGSAHGPGLACLRRRGEFVMGGDEHEAVAVGPDIVIEQHLIGAAPHEQDADSGEEIFERQPTLSLRLGSVFVQERQVVTGSGDAAVERAAEIDAEAGPANYTA